MQDWMKWINSISKKGQLADGGLHIMNEGKVLRPDNVVEDNPYTVNKESVNGFIVASAANKEDDAEIAKECPILNG
ncbi:hypothetical protein SAMN05421877_10295 [Sphingobacterium lactis]|uniref:YCII-related domain-containing protein n=2 Tax=Sphingobacterium lactis TaxID=797291 RepID=A0A1H5TXZ5_9SPHI|nr:hypothetical protein SAMN05421877_10295 [Sphingobacterium lactis]